ncbi:MAG TPA: hypothetical protein VGW11_02415 [Solirubrobacteraceae bacterium]|nr:hypothetical protein [Solirubrobacteraceae bacterium]
MRDRILHEALAALAAQAAERLSGDIDRGVQVPFEVVERGGRGGVGTFYCYRPLTGGFIGERIALLAELPAWPAAVRALGALDGVGHYLRARGEERVPAQPRERAAVALRVFLQDVFSDAEDFALADEHLETAWRRLHAGVFEGRGETVLVVRVLGLALASDELALGDGVSLWRAGALPGVPSALSHDEGPDEHERVLAVVAVGEEIAGRQPLAAARTRLRRVLTALRLYDRARPALDPLAWWREAEGAWAPLALGVAGAPRGTLLVHPDAEDELCAFCSLVTRRTPNAGELAWSLRRHELGCERPSAAEGLTDHLLALRALLEPEGPAAGRLPGRLAALCALPGERATLAGRVAEAVELERGVVAGLAGGRGAAAEALGAELADHLRALLRDVLCGHLKADLRGLADELAAAEAAEAAAV